MGEKIRFESDGSSGFSLPPEGKYIFEIAAASPKTSKDGEPQIEVKLQVADGPEAGKSFRMWYTMTKERSGFFRRLADAVGADVDDTGGGLFEVDLDDLVGRYFSATFTHFIAKNGAKYPNLRDEAPTDLGHAVTPAPTQPQAPVQPMPTVAQAPAAASAVFAGRRPR